jgi:hypothetical protein
VCCLQVLALFPLYLYDETAVSPPRVAAPDSAVSGTFSYNSVANEYHAVPTLERAGSAPVSEPRDDISEERTGSEPSTKIQQPKAAEPSWPSSPSSTSPLVDSDAGGVAAVAMQTDDDLSVLGATSTLWRQIQTPGGVTTLLIVFSYKFGEAVSDNMFKPYLLDQGFTKAQISMWTGVYGMGFSTAGSLAGGFVVKTMVGIQARQQQEQKQVRESQDQSSTSDGSGKQKPLSSAQQSATERKGIAGATKESEGAAAATAAAAGGGGSGGGGNTILLSAVTFASALEALAQLGRFVAACATTETLSSEHGQLALQMLIMYESFCGGLLTTIIFTYMMASVDKSIGESCLQLEGRIVSKLRALAFHLSFARYPG